MANIPCHGCWWIENDRCYQDKLADVHGLTKAPRIGDPKPYGLEITDPLITACVERAVHQRKSGVYGRLFAHLDKAGVKVTVLTSGGNDR